MSRATEPASWKQGNAIAGLVLSTDPSYEQAQRLLGFGGLVQDVAASALLFGAVGLIAPDPVSEVQQDMRCRIANAFLSPLRTEIEEITDLWIAQYELPRTVPSAIPFTLKQIGAFIRDAGDSRVLHWVPPGLTFQSIRRVFPVVDESERRGVKPLGLEWSTASTEGRWVLWSPFSWRRIERRTEGEISTERHAWLKEFGRKNGFYATLPSALEMIYLWLMIKDACTIKIGYPHRYYQSSLDCHIKPDMEFATSDLSPAGVPERIHVRFDETIHVSSWPTDQKKQKVTYHECSNFTPLALAS